MAQPGSHLAPVAGGLRPGESPPRDWQLPCGRESDSFPAMAVAARRDVETLQAALAASEARAAAAEQQITSLKLHHAAASCRLQAAVPKASVWSGNMCGSNCADAAVIDPNVVSGSRADIVLCEV